MDETGLEPVTFRLQGGRSPSWTTSPKKWGTNAGISPLKNLAVFVPSWYCELAPSGDSFNFLSHPRSGVWRNDVTAHPLITNLCNKAGRVQPSGYPCHDDPVLLYGDRQSYMFITPELRLNRHPCSCAPDLVLVGGKINAERPLKGSNLRHRG